MADYDAGHYFLTVAAPIERNATRVVNGRKCSLLDNLRDTLAALPTAQQDEFSADTGLNSPFARVPGTHFARFFVLDDVRYNGRRPSSAILNLILNVKMTVAEEVDQLPCAYLIMTIDFDATDGSDAALKAYTDELWRHMSDELVDIFGHCTGFDGVQSAQGFFDYIRRVQVHTTMPFSDYWTSAPPITNPLPLFAAIALSIPVLALAVGVSGIWPWNPWSLAASAFAVVFLLILAITFKRGLTPFPPAPDSDLASMLKAIYIQQMFVGFMIDNLGRGGNDLYETFGAFSAMHLPANIQVPTQPSGVLISRWKPK